MTPLRQLQVGSQLSAPLLVREARLRARREGGEALRLRLADRSATVPAIVLEDVGAAHAVCVTGAVVFVCGQLRTDEPYGTRLVVESVRPAAAHEYDRHDLVDGPARPVALLESDLRELVATVQRPQLRALLHAVLGEDAESWPAFREAPAAKHYHQAYRHGLLEHSLTVAQAVGAMSATFGGVDRDIAVVGALLHDVGKLDTYRFDGDAIAMTDEGRLYGEIALGYYRIRRAIESIDDFPAELSTALLHIILSHHGSLEHGSPVVPCTREATLVHMADNLGARLGSFDRLQKTLADDECWSPYDKGLGAGAYFPQPAPPAPPAPLPGERAAA